MGKFIQTTDFAGKFKIAQTGFSNLDFYINKYESLILIDLLGATLYDLFLADCTGSSPSSVIYKNIYNAFHIDENNTIHVSEGMKTMLLGMIYFEYIRDQKYKNTDSGTTVSQSENSREVVFDESNIAGRRNEALLTYSQIQWYIRLNITTYPTFNGKMADGFQSPYSWL